VEADNITSIKSVLAAAEPQEVVIMGVPQSMRILPGSWHDLGESVVFETAHGTYVAPRSAITLISYRESLVLHLAVDQRVFASEQEAQSVAQNRGGTAYACGGCYVQVPANSPFMAKSYMDTVKAWHVRPEGHAACHKHVRETGNTGLARAA
jgi:hypothetical protein